jgi:ATP-binding cassette subfamily B protein
MESVWSGQVVFLKRVYLLNDEDQPFGLRWFLPEILKQGSAFRDIAIATLVLNFVSLGTPLFTQLVVDKVLVHENASTLWVLTIGAVLLIFFECAFTYLRQYLLLSATNKIDIRLSRRIFSHLMTLPIDFFESNTAGLITRQVQQIQAIRSFLTGSLFFTILESAAFFVFLPLLFSYSIKLTCVVLVISLLMAAVVVGLIKPFTSRLERLSNAESKRQSMLVESIHGMKTIKSLAIEPKQRKVWDQRSADSVTLNFSVMSISLTAQTLTQFLQRIMTIAIIVFGALEVFDRQMTLGALIAFQMLSGRVVGPLVQVVGLVHEFQQTNISVKMLADVMNHPPERKSKTGLRPLLYGKITFEDVTFRYPSTTVAALDRININIEPGQVIGVVGRSGSGKTTFAKLLQGMYTAQEGLIRLDGVDLREMDLAYMRQNIGVVLQENFMFRGTIRENIAITKSDASFEQIVQAARTAGADEFIERLPNGYDTFLEENATNLSGGQRQRLAIARALLTQPKILILDEAASALDPESESIFMANLGQIVKGKTVIIISHRLSTLVNSDKIIFFQRGEVLDAAPHTVLLSRCEPYAHLWSQQMGHIT